MSEHDSEKWTGQRIGKLDLISMGAGAAIATGILLWAIFASVDQDAFGANILTEGVGILIEVSLVLYIVDRLTKLRERQAFSIGINEVQRRLEQAAPRSAKKVLDCLEIFLLQDPTNEATFTNQRRYLSRSLEQQITTLQSSHHEYRNEIQHAPELATALRDLTGKLTSLNASLRALPNDTMLDTTGGISAMLQIVAVKDLLKTTRSMLETSLTGDPSWDSWPYILLGELEKHELKFKETRPRNPEPDPAHPRP